MGEGRLGAEGGFCLWEEPPGSRPALGDDRKCVGVRRFNEGAGVMCVCKAEGEELHSSTSTHHQTAAFNYVPGEHQRACCCRVAPSILRWVLCIQMQALPCYSKTANNFESIYIFRRQKRIKLCWDISPHWTTKLLKWIIGRTGSFGQFSDVSHWSMAASLHMCMHCKSCSLLLHDFFPPLLKAATLSRLALSSKFIPPRNLDKQKLSSRTWEPDLHSASGYLFLIYSAWCFLPGATLSFLWPVTITNQGFYFSFLSLLEKFLEPSMILRSKGRNMYIYIFFHPGRSALCLQGIKYPACDLTV